jgi:uncharacterized protein YeaO (DUF488 family)
LIDDEQTTLNEWFDLSNEEINQLRKRYTNEMIETMKNDTQRKKIKQIVETTTCRFLVSFFNHNHNHTQPHTYIIQISIIHSQWIVIVFIGELFEMKL